MVWGLLPLISVQLSELSQVAIATDASGVERSALAGESGGIGWGDLHDRVPGPSLQGFFEGSAQAGGG